MIILNCLLIRQHSNTSIIQIKIPNNSIISKTYILYKLYIHFIYKHLQKLSQLAHPLNSYMNQQQQLNPSSDQPDGLDAQSSPYFQLMKYVGTDGKYQKISLAIWCILWMTTGTILLGTPFFMLNPPYICPSLPQQQCQKLVCSLPQQDRPPFLDPSALHTLSNNFADLHCSKSWIPDMLASLVYMGCFFGYISISIMVDNMGRKKALLIAYGVATLGMVLLAVSTNLYMAGVGLFLMGYGSDSAINICFYFITETVETKSRQKYSIFIQIFFSLGGVINVGYFYIFKNWKIITWVFLIAPSLICLAVILKIVKDTPYFLVKLRSRQSILSDLNQIHKLNNNGNSLTPQNQQKLRQMITQLLHLQHQQANVHNMSAYPYSRHGSNPSLHGQHTQNSPRNTPRNQNNNVDDNIDNKSHTSRTHAYSKHKIYTPMDLFRYKSIRFISISVCLLSTFIYILYYGPLMLISKLSFNLYINALVVTASELVTYPLSYFFIERIPRQKIGYILYAICGVASFVLIFIISNLCEEGIHDGQCQLPRVMELVFIFVFRFCSSLEFAIFLVYCNQVFPTQIRGIGIGISSALGTVASTASPYIFGSYIDSNLQTSRIMIVFVVISVVGVGLWCKLPETLGEPILDEICEVKEEYEREFKGGEDGKHVELVEVKESD